jgi:trk system potassium uptake protein
VYLPLRRHRAELRIRDGFLVVAGFWVVLGLAGRAAAAGRDSDHELHGRGVRVRVRLHHHRCDGAGRARHAAALGAVVPQQTQWFGGMGIIILAVAILPVLGVGGMQLYRAEMPGPVKDTKLTPRIAETAKALWIAYFGLTVIAATSIPAGGHDLVRRHLPRLQLDRHRRLLDARRELRLLRQRPDGVAGRGVHVARRNQLRPAFLRDAAPDARHQGLRHRGPARTFSAGRTGARSRSPGPIRGYTQDPEFRTFIVIQLVLIAIIAGYLALMGHHTAGESLTKAMFQSVSIGTTTGFTSTDFLLLARRPARSCSSSRASSAAVRARRRAG